MDQPLKLHIELDNDVDAASVQKILIARLATLEGVEESDVQQPKKRITGAEVVAIIGVAVVVAKSTKGAVDALTEVIKSLSKLVKEVKGLRAVVVETKSGRKNLAEVTAQDLA